MPNTYEQTSIWKRTLAALPPDSDESHRARLRVAYKQTRHNASALVQRIHSSLPGLTVHDVTHLDALWEVADLIAGPDYPVTPLEAFVFGAAILVHDAALCFEAYEGGLAAVRQTDVWKDHYQAERERLNDLPVERHQKAANFLAVRALHAHQAEQLYERSWIHPGSSAQLFLLEDQELRIHFGSLLGRVAASHHWSLEEISVKLPSIVNSLPSLPSSWRVDPVKVALLLRCADACHIDKARAPDFLHALTKRNSVSHQHWQAQNWLSRVAVHPDDALKDLLIFTSTRDFPPEEQGAWWVAYEADGLSR